MKMTIEITDSEFINLSNGTMLALFQSLQLIATESAEEKESKRVVPIPTPVAAKKAEPKQEQVKEEKPAKKVATEKVEAPAPEPKEEVKAEPKQKEPVKTVPTVTRDDLKAKLVELTHAGKSANAKAILTEAGYKNLSSVKEEDIEALYKKACELL